MSPIHASLTFFEQQPKFYFTKRTNMIQYL